MRLLQSLNWPTWFLPVLGTLGMNTDQDYYFMRVATVVLTAVAATVVGILLPPWTMLIVLPGAWIFGAWWAGYRSDNAPTVGVNHDVYASCITIMFVSLIRLGIWWWLKA